VLRGCDVTCTTSEDCAEWRRERQTMPAWTFRRYGSAGMRRWYRLFATRGDALSFDDAWCPHDSNDSNDSNDIMAPCEACVRVESVCPHCSPRRCLTGNVGA
jgi:hypothetical protein